MGGLGLARHATVCTAHVARIAGAFGSNARVQLLLLLGTPCGRCSGPPSQDCFPCTVDDSGAFLASWAFFSPQCTGVVALLGIPWWWATTSGFYLQCRPPCLFLCCCCDASSAVQAEQRPHQSASHMMCMCV